MKYISIFLFYILCALNVSAQDGSADNMSIDAVFKACIAMRDAVSANDSAAIKQSAKDLKDAGTTSFSSLRCKDDSISSLNGHLVFDEAFADSIAEGKDVYDKTDDFTRTTAAHRGQTADGSILTKTCFVKAGKSTKYSFASKGHQELAVVAEAGGLVTMKIHVTNSAGLDKRFDDTKSVKKGMPQRKTSFELPTDRRNTVELEIVNCGNKDCSFVVISN
jgi:predicted enzyme related to lactoylglutathione lyase